MTDVPDGSGPIRRTRVNDGGAPVSGVLAMVLAVVAVLAGFFILRSITDGGDDGGGLLFADETSSDASPGVADDDESVDSTVPTDPTTTTTTEPPIVVEGAKVVVANANGIGGSAGNMTDALRLGPGFDTVTPTNASSSTPELEQSIIYYDTTVPAAQVVADSLSRSLGGDVPVEPMPESIPTADGTLNGAQVLLMLGTDKANRTLDELNPTQAAEVTAPATETTAAPADG